MWDQVLAVDRYIWQVISSLWTHGILTLTVSFSHSINLVYNTISHSWGVSSSSCFFFSLLNLSPLPVLLSMFSLTCCLPLCLSVSCSPVPLLYWTLRICADSPWCQFFSLAKRGPFTSDSNLSLMVRKGRLLPQVIHNMDYVKNSLTFESQTRLFFWKISERTLCVVNMKLLLATCKLSLDWKTGKTTNLGSNILLPANEI